MPVPSLGDRLCRALFRNAGTANVAVACAYFVTGRIGLLLPYSGEHVTLIWPPIGIAFAACLLLGARVIPGILVGAFLVNFTTTPSVSLALMIAIGNSLAPWLGSLAYSTIDRSSRPLTTWAVRRLRSLLHAGGQLHGRSIVARARR